MKIVVFIIVVFFLFVSSNAQSQKISREEHEKIFQFAVEQTNTDYPVIFTVITNSIENGKTVSTVTDVTENESQGFSRSKKTTLADGKETNLYQISTGFGNNFCSTDGIKWEASQYECEGSITLYGKRDPESVEYSVTAKTVKGKKVKVYREYSVFAPFKEGGKKDFWEKISTIDSRGFFITVEDTEGTLAPKVVTLTRKQSWITKAKIKPIVAPIK